MVVETKEKTQSRDTPLEKGQSSEEQKVAPKKENTYSETDYLKAVSDEKTISGRLKADLEAATKERDTFKTQAKEATTALFQEECPETGFFPLFQLPLLFSYIIFSEDSPFQKYALNTLFTDNKKSPLKGF